MTELADQEAAKVMARPQNARAYLALSGSTPIEITAITDLRCRWPIDDVDALQNGSNWSFCGLPVTRHRYCKTHAGMAYRKGG